jgi:beta-glucosidase
VTRTFSRDFLWGAATAAHQIEGNNLNNDWWKLEHDAADYIQFSGDAIDSYHRFEEDMRLLADVGFNAYRFSIEWSRIEPSPGKFSRAELAHYRRMIETAVRLGLSPVVTLHHFTHPIWFDARGAWLGDGAVEAFSRYVEQACTILDGVEWVCTINEPNVLAVNLGLRRRAAAGKEYRLDGALPDPEIGQALAAAHRAAAPLVRAATGARVGWTVANQALVPAPGVDAKYAEEQYQWEDMYLEVARHDDFVGVQSYTSQLVDENGVVAHPPHPDNTLTGWAYRPDALGIAVRHTHQVVGDVPILVTENGIATNDDRRRIAYTSEALRHLGEAMDDGIDVRGYLHWSLLDNFEWGRWEPTFGLIAVDRETFVRHPKPSLAWLGAIARTGQLA